MIHAAATPSHACNFVMPLHTEAQQKILQKNGVTGKFADDFTEKVMLRQKKTDANWHPFIPKIAEPEKLFSGFGTLGSRCVRVAPADFVALGGGTKFALFALSGGFKCPAAAHFFEDSLGVQFRFKTLESTVNGLAFLHSHSTHAMILGWFGLVPRFVRGALDGGIRVACQDRTRCEIEKRGACAADDHQVFTFILWLSTRSCGDRSVKHPTAEGLSIPQLCIVFHLNG